MNDPAGGAALRVALVVFACATVGCSRVATAGADAAPEGEHASVVVDDGPAPRMDAAQRDASEEVPERAPDAEDECQFRGGSYNDSLANARLNCDYAANETDWFGTRESSGGNLGFRCCRD